MDFDSLKLAHRSEFNRGRTSDWVEHIQKNPVIFPSIEPLFTQSNARILIGHASNGSLRFTALPTAVYPAPTQTGEFGLGPGMYHHFDVLMYVGDVHYRIILDDPEREIDLAAEDHTNESYYADYFLPVTTADDGDLEILIISLAPVAPDASRSSLTPAPLPGPPGMIYALFLRNHANIRLKGKVILQAGDMLLGHYDDARPDMQELKRPTVDLRQHTLILTRPEGSVGIHLHNGHWTKRRAPFQAEVVFDIAAGEHTVIETHLVSGQNHSSVMEAIYALHMHSILEWLDFTATFWHSRLGNLQVDAKDSSEHARLARELYLRNLLDNFNCLQTDAQGNLIAHWQGAPSHGYGTVWGIDVEPTAVSIVHICPELTRQVLLFFMNRSRVPKGTPDHSLPILVAPVIIARQWLQVSGDIAFLRDNPEVMQSLESIMDQVISLEADIAALFPSRYSSDGVVGRRYDYGTNVKVWYAFDSMAYLLNNLGRGVDAMPYAEKAHQIQLDIQRTMLADGPFGIQISGGTNLDMDPGTFYLPETALYYDGEDTSSMLAPVYGLSDFSDSTWINYHRFARSLWHAGYDPEFDTLYWHPAEPAVLDGTAYFSRLAGSVTPTEMREGLDILRQTAIDDVTGSVFWWPHGVEYKRSLTRCSQGQGAWAWQFFQQWLGIKVDAPSKTIIFAPRGLITSINWPDFRSGSNQFYIEWSESEIGAQFVIQNSNPDAWTVQVGFRKPGSGALNDLQWQSRVLLPGEKAIFTSTRAAIQEIVGLPRVELGTLEANAFGDAQGILFKRFGPALLWGHWNPDMRWRWDHMPLALRFIVANFTNTDWINCYVDLECPQDWKAQGRLPLHWSYPDDLRTGVIRLELGELRKVARTVAPFWIKAPFDFEIITRWGDLNRPFHLPSQPGAGLTVYARHIKGPIEGSFIAHLSMITVDHHHIERSLAVLVKILPYE